MRQYTLPSGDVIDLDQVIRVGALFVNKNHSQYNSYEVYLSNGTSFGVFDDNLLRTTFLATWEV